MFKNFSNSLVSNDLLNRQILTFDDVLPKHICDLSFDFLKLFRPEKELRASVGGFDNFPSIINPTIRDAYFSDENSLLLADVRENLKQSLTSCLIEYLIKLDLDSVYDFKNFVPDSNFSYVIYEPLSRGYQTHVDSCHTNANLVRRLFSCVFYLNDDFYGGELYFPRLNKKIKPKPNSCVVFPSSYLFPHKALPVVKGRKVICPTWFGYQPPEAPYIGSII